MVDPKYVLVLYGATGFTGRLVAEYLKKVPDLQNKQWAIAGRSPSKLAELQTNLELGANVGLITAELTDAAATAKLVASTKAVINCAGPYSEHHGEELLGECARRGVHYSDLAGEGFWQAEMATKFHAVAEKSAAKIVLGGGVDSIPSDLGCMLAVDALSKSLSESHPGRSGEESTISVQGVYTEYTGSFSGGTLNSGRAMSRARKEGRVTSAMEVDPYMLAPGAQGADSAVGTADGMPADFGWGLRLQQPFFMAKINARVVRRSLALRGLQQRISYAECSSLGLWLRILWVYVTRGCGYFRGEPINFKPKSGEGPPSWLIKEGGFNIEVTAAAPSGAKAIASVRGKGDPGYGATAKMLAEVGLCLGLDAHQHAPGGVLTPSTGLGQILVSRLGRAEGGTFMKLDVHLSA